MTEIEMSPEILTVDYEGSPGKRTFFVQARGEVGTFAYLIEKEQVSVLADKLREMLLLVDNSDSVASVEPARDPALSVEQPVDLEWRVGTIGLAYEEENDSMVILMQPVSEEEAQDELSDEGARFVLRRDQVRSFVLHALAVVEEGRPTCRLCGLPMDADGHFCPASNGHREEA